MFATFYEIIQISDGIELQLVVRSEAKQFDKQLVLFAEKTGESNADQSLKNQRKGQPTKRIAVNIHNIATEYPDDWNELLERIYQVKANEKKYKGLKVQLPRIRVNELPDPYYIPTLRSFYIGEWTYDHRIADNIPNGIGRLYQEDWILEGSIRTTITSKIDTTAVKDNEPNIFEKISLDNIDLSMSLVQKEESFIQKLRQQQVAFEIHLEGIGRKSNRYCEMSGEFSQSVLNGKGSYKVKDEEYFYEGGWVNDKKHGKGVETTRLTSYDGDFVDDMREGRGALLFYLSQHKENERKEEEAELAKRSEEEEKELRSTLNHARKIRMGRQHMINEVLEKFKWKNPFQISNTIFNDENFLLQRKIKTKFLEKYIGEFVNNEMEGKGAYYWFNGKAFNGQWKQGKIDGVGEFYWPDGAIYRGEYRQDKKHGKGEIIWNERKKYRGSWAFGVRHGYGETIEITADAHAFLTIKGELWNQDKEEKHYFVQRIELPKYHTIQAMHVKNYTEGYEEEDSF